LRQLFSWRTAVNQRARKVPPVLKVPKAHKAPLDLKGRKASPARKVRWGRAEWPVRRVSPEQSAQLALPAQLLQLQRAL